MFAKGMTVGELIEALEKLDKTKLVWQSLDHYCGKITEIETTESGDYMLKEVYKGCPNDYDCENCQDKQRCDEEIG